MSTPSATSVIPPYPQATGFKGAAGPPVAQQTDANKAYSRMLGSASQENETQIGGKTDDRACT